MAQGDVALVESAFAAWNRGDIGAFAGHMTEDVAWLEVSGRPEAAPTERRGRERLREALESLFEAWESYHLDVERLDEVDGRVLAVVREVGRGRTSGVEIDGRWGYLITVVDGAIARVEAYRDPAQALREAGPRAGMPEIEALVPEQARDEVLVEELVGIVNAAYAVGEAGLWRAGATRTTPAEMAEAIRSGGVIAATLDGRLVGCAYTRPLDAATADLGLVSAAPDQWGTGVGRELVQAAEELMRAEGVTAMQLELLVPKGWVHPEKERLGRWYRRLGYRVVRAAPFEQVAAHLTPQLAAPCEFLIFRKPLA